MIKPQQQEAQQNPSAHFMEYTVSPNLSALLQLHLDSLVQDCSNSSA